MDLAVRKTPSVARRFMVELLRVTLIYSQIIGLIHFLLTPKTKRLRAFRKNEIVYYVWLLSREFPKRYYYKRIRSWLERTVYLDRRTSPFRPEPLKGDEAFLSEMLDRDKKISHSAFIAGLEAGDWRPIVRVGVALTKMDPRLWMGKKRFLVQMTFSSIQSLLFLAALGFLFWNARTAIVCLLLAIVLFAIDRRILKNLVLKRASTDNGFYEDAINNRAIQLHW